MQPHHERWVELVEQSAANVHERVEDGRLRVCILSGTGHGDHARGLAFADALKSKYQNCHIFLVMHFTGTMVEFDLAHAAHQCGAIDAYLPIHSTPREMLISRLWDKFDVLFDCIPYPVGTYWNLARIHKGEPEYRAMQARADQRLAPFRCLYDDHPIGCWKMKLKPITQWEIMSVTGGIEVGPLGIIAPTECAPFPENPPEALKAHAGSDNWTKARLSNIGQYVTIHNSAGRLSNVKVAPPEVMEAVVARLKKVGLKAVQVGGSKEEARIEGTINRLGYRLPITCSLLRDAVCHIDVEGFLVYMAAALGKRSVVFFGPTPRFVFGVEGNLNLLRVIDADVPCPIGTCFWGGGYWQPEKWAASCRLAHMKERDGRALNPNAPHCLNMVEPEEAANQVEAYVRMLEGQGITEREEAVA